MGDRHQFPTSSIILLIIIIISQQVVCEICYEPICEYTLVINREQNLIWKDSVTGLVFEVEYDDVSGRFQVAESPFIPGEFVGDEVDIEDVVTTDGVKRSLFTINGQFPAPVMEVTAGAQVVVHVVNKLLDETITVHWHGLDQRGTPWMDGVDFVTQCPIQPLHNFTYRFIAEPAGTFWYHSHMGSQTNDGLKGMLIIHKEAPSVPYHPVMLTDWYHYEGHEIAATDPPHGGTGGHVWGAGSDRLIDGTGETIILWQSALINGRGRAADGPTWPPLTTFAVTPGMTTLFRVVNSGAEFSLEVSIDSHKLRLTAIDGAEVTPVVADSIIVPLGGRADFEIDAMEATDNYWMRAQTTKDLVADPTPREVTAIVHYIGASESSEPTSSERVCTAADPCTVVGCALLRYPASAYTSCYNVAELRHEYEEGERYKYGINSAEPDVEIFLNARIAEGVSFNSYNFIPPSSPVYQTDSQGEPCTSCTEVEPCHCTHMVDIPFNKSVQIVITNLNINMDTVPIAPHPIHMHGHHFAILKMGFSDYKDYEPGDPPFAIASTPNPDVTCDDALCRHASWTPGSPSGLNTFDPPLADTVTLPPSGYIVIRFRSDNPGPWFFHCHNNHHTYPLGYMKVMLNVGQSHYPPVPPGMPTCAGKFELTDDQFEDYLDRSLSAIKYGGEFEPISVPPVPPPACPTIHYPPPPVPPVHPQDKDLVVLTREEYIGWLVGCVLIGIVLTSLVAAIIMCCILRTRTPSNQVHFHNSNGFTNHGSKLFYAVPGIQQF